MMKEDAAPLVRLQDVRTLLASGSLDDSLQGHAELARRLLGATSCSIMLLNGDSPDDLRMRMCARCGDLPPEAAEALVGRGEGIAGRVLADGRPLLVEDIASSPFAGFARRNEAELPALMSAPIRIDGHVAGVVNVAGAAFGERDLSLLEVTGLYIGKSIHVIQLQHLLESRFAQLALLREAEHAAAPEARTGWRQPEEVARILARSFFKEMRKAGFEAGQIVGAASELIDQLNRELQLPGDAGRH